MRCFTCNRVIGPRNSTGIYDNERADARVIASARRQALGHPALEVGPDTRVCNNCYQQFLEEIRLQQEQPRPFTLQLNVLRQGRNNSCLFCNRVDNLRVLSVESKIDVFAKCNIYIPEHVNCCRLHLDDDGYILQHYLRRLQCVNRHVVINPQYFQRYLEALQSYAHGRKELNNVNDSTEQEMLTLTSLSKEQFNELYTYCDDVPQPGGVRRVYKKDLLMFLCKMRQGISDEFLTVLFKYSTRQATSMAVDKVRQSLLNRFVPENIGLGAITREQFINRHVTPFANALYNPNPQKPQAIVYTDGTYTFCFKSSNFRALRQTFCVHKGRHLVKPALMCAPDGYILDIHGPYFSDAQNNDAAMLRNEFDNDEELANWFQEGDIMIVDRGYRDAIEMLENRGIRCFMPPLLEPGEDQLTTEQANGAKLVTTTRWVVESRNGHFKSIYKLLAQVQQIHGLTKVGDYYRIGGALINRYHVGIHMRNDTVEHAQDLLRRAQQRNNLQDRVIDEELADIDGQRWIRLDEGELMDFPVLTMEYLRTITAGVYQINLAPSYIQDKLQRDENDVFEVEMLRLQNRIPDPGLLRVRVFSRHRQATRYQLWIEYEPNANEEEEEPITGHYCTCIAGARTLGTCAHVASVLWFLGFARHQDNVHYPSHRTVNEIEDAGNRPPQENPH